MHFGHFRHHDRDETPSTHCPERSVRLLVLLHFMIPL
jgi:hypothetical protein